MLVSMVDLKEALHVDPFIPLREGTGQALPHALSLGTALAAGVQFTLLGAALLSLLRRKPSQVRGSRLAWGAFSLVNFVGPISYFLFGRKR